MRGNKPYVFTNLKLDVGVADIIDFIIREGMLETKNAKTPEIID